MHVQVFFIKKIMFSIWKEKFHMFVSVSVLMFQIPQWLTTIWLY